jgi:hypothetical protein
MTQHFLIGMHDLLSSLPSLDVLVMFPVKNLVLSISWLHGTCDYTWIFTNYGTYLFIFYGTT